MYSIKDESTIDNSKMVTKLSSFGQRKQVAEARLKTPKNKLI